MSIRVVCPICRHGFVIAERAGHRSIDCPACRNTFVFTAESQRALTGQRPETVDDHERPRSPTRSVRPLVTALIASAVALVVLTATMIGLLALRDHDPDVAEAEPRTDAEASSTVPPGAPGTSGDVFSVTHRLSRDLAGLLPTAAEEPLPESSAAPPVSAEGSPPPAPGSLPTPPSDRPLTTADIVARSEPSVAKIAGPSSSGSGFLARPGLVATNAHVVEGELIQDLRVTFPSAPAGRQGPFQPELILLDAGRDLAILRVPSDLPPLPVAPTYTFRKGEDVTIIGSPGIGPQVLENAVSRGVLSTRIQVEGQDFYQLSAAVNPGNSGGPVFDSFGRVIGVVTWKARQGEALAFCITAEDLNRGLTRAESEAVRPPDQRLLAQLPRLSYAWKPGEAYQYEVKWNTRAPRSASPMKARARTRCFSPMRKKPALLTVARSPGGLRRAAETVVRPAPASPSKRRM